MRFFDRYEPGELRVAAEEILPGVDTPPEVRDRAVYRHYLDHVAARSLDPELRPARQKALAGSLETADFRRLDDLFEGVKQQARTGGPVDGYSRVNAYCLLIAQILFADNCVREGLLDRVVEPQRSRTLLRIAEHAAARAGARGKPIHDDEARFYATVFLLQTAFDKIFVPDEDLVVYDRTTGEVRVADDYHEWTAYLELANRKVLTAPRAEKRLCYNLTTGWSDGIDRRTWDALNASYYAAESPTTGEKNLFTEHYDALLERMLPQFKLAKTRLADQVLTDHPASASLRVLEIGAGSGAFAIDLLMACRRHGREPGRLRYQGVEPSGPMRDRFRSNLESKLGGGVDVPAGWSLAAGSLEAVTDDPERYLADVGDETVVVFSFSPHHCFHDSLRRFLDDPAIGSRARALYVLEGTQEHGWTKPYYMWADCESPENFDNNLLRGRWRSETLWVEPERWIEGHALTRAWCSLRRLTWP